MFLPLCYPRFRRALDTLLCVVPAYLGLSLEGPDTNGTAAHWLSVRVQGGKGFQVEMAGMRARRQELPGTRATAAE